MRKENCFNPASARIFVAGASFVLLLLVLAPPILASLGFSFQAAGFYFLFSGLCHQLPERAFTIFDFPLAVCHRCTGIYLGFFIGSVLKNPWIHRSPAVRRIWILAAILPLAFDAVAPLCGLWTNTYWTRFLTGLIFGIPTASLLIQGIAEFITEAPWRTLAPGGSRLQGGLS